MFSTTTTQLVPLTRGQRAACVMTASTAKQQPVCSRHFRSASHLGWLNVGMCSSGEGAREINRRIQRVHYAATFVRRPAYRRRHECYKTSRQYRQLFTAGYKRDRRCARNTSPATHCKLFSFQPDNLNVNIL